MQRYTITLGASTTAGGKVISASSQGSIDGAKIAVEGDLILCPACKSQGKILCIDPRISETWDGKQVALQNDLCLCGCVPSPRLIASQTSRSQVIDDGAPVNEPASIGGRRSMAVDGAMQADEGYDLEFQVLDAFSGLPVANCPYHIDLAGGQRLDGRTDENGKTTKVIASHPEDAILRVYEPEPTPINPFWDR